MNIWTTLKLVWMVHFTYVVGTLIQADTLSHIKLWSNLYHVEGIHQLSGDLLLYFNAMISIKNNFISWVSSYPDSFFSLLPVLSNIEPCPCLEWYPFLPPIVFNRRAISIFYLSHLVALTHFPIAIPFWKSPVLAVLVSVTNWFIPFLAWH